MPSKHAAGGCNCCGPCVCDYSHSLTYSSSSCTLTFVLTNNCGDIVEADIEVVVTGPDGVDTTPPVISGSTYTWTLYKPTLGDWSVATSIDCPDELLEFLDEITVDDTYACVCCETSRPDFATISGSSACCASAAGTYVFNFASDGGGLDCTWTKAITNYSTPSVPCNNECFQFSRTEFGVTTVYYFYFYAATVVVYLDEIGPDTPQIIVNITWLSYRRIDGGACQLSPQALWGGSQWRYRSNCASGECTLIPSTASFDNGELTMVWGPTGFYVPCTAPTVYLELV